MFSLGTLPSSINRLLVGPSCRFVFLEDSRSSSFVSKVLGIQGNLSLETSDETGAVGEVDLQLRSAIAVFVEIADANDFPGKFFTFDHELFGGSEVYQTVHVSEDITLIVCRLIVVNPKA